MSAAASGIAREFHFLATASGDSPARHAQQSVLRSSEHMICHHVPVLGGTDISSGTLAFEPQNGQANKSLERTAAPHVVGDLVVIEGGCRSVLRWAARSCVSKFDVVLTRISFFALRAWRHVWWASVPDGFLSVCFYRGDCLHVMPCVQFSIYIERHRRDSPTIQIERTRRIVRSFKVFWHIVSRWFSRRAAHLER